MLHPKQQQTRGKQIYTSIYTRALLIALALGLADRVEKGLDPHREHIALARAVGVVVMAII